MKLYLSSYRLGDEVQKLGEMAGPNKKAAVIANAMDFLTDEVGRKQSAEREIEDLKVLGFEPEEVDLRDYFGQSEKLEAKLSEYGLLWVRGGNVFILRKAFKESGMDRWLARHKDDKELVYGGYSAAFVYYLPS